MLVQGVILVIELYLLVVTIDVLLGWVQPDPLRWPRRATDRLTEPILAPLRAVVPAGRTGGLDISPLIVVAIFGGVRVWLLSWF